MLKLFKFTFLKKILVKKDNTSDKDLKTIIKNGAFLVDLRTIGEFAQGHVPGSINIPLNELGRNLNLFKNKKNIVVCCFSGNRSGFAKDILEKKGFKNVINGGAWEEIYRLVNK
ncbi:rhodanese-like domain-containing protein [Flavobacterium sp.]|uniref:rhodanese-like domain-containing protein n=1 Tax=Flavobacterium sp. TaxID=239 RepID=UPI00286B33E3|nr:rhodanese-like domain-containing protein [Flavobacterium sp.]